MHIQHEARNSKLQYSCPKLLILRFLAFQDYQKFVRQRNLHHSNPMFIEIFKIINKVLLSQVVLILVDSVFQQLEKEL